MLGLPWKGRSDKEGLREEGECGEEERNEMELFELIENRLLSHRLLCAQGSSLDACARGCEYLVRMRIDTVRPSSP